MATKRPQTIAQYIKAAPREGQPQLKRLYAILKKAAPKAQQGMKWGTPFFMEPRFLFAFSAHKAHLNFTPLKDGLKPFRRELKKYRITPAGMLQIPYGEPLPEALIRRIAVHKVKTVRARKSKGFWS